MITITARTIEEAWWSAWTHCLAQGFEYKIERGSFKDHTRLQLRALVVTILNPETRPLAPVLQKVPSVATDESIIEYFTDYIINPEKKPDEDYTYGSRIMLQVEQIIDMLRKTPYTNQAVFSVSQPSDVLLKDPPCLRSLSLKLTPEGLQQTTYWRSWDLYAGFPTNIGGFQLFLEFIAQETGLAPGPQVAFSDGAHLYDYQVKFLRGE